MQLSERQLTDGSTRPVYRDDDGRQYVLDGDGEPGRGVWSLAENPDLGSNGQLIR